MISQSCYASLPLDSQKLWGYLLNQKFNYNSIGTTSDMECTRKKKGPVEKINTGGSLGDVFAVNEAGESYRGKLMCPWSPSHHVTPTLALEEPCWHRYIQGLGQEGSSSQIFCWWPSSFFPFNSLGPSLLPLFHLIYLPSSLFLFSSSSQVPSSRGWADVLFPSFCHFLCIGPCQGWFHCFYTPFSSHMNSWESVLGKYGDDTIGIYEFVERNNLFCFTTALSARSTSEFWYSLSIEFLYFQKLALHSAPHDSFPGSWNFDQVQRKSRAWVKWIKTKTKYSFKMKWVRDLESWWGSRFHIKLESVKTLHIKCLHQSSFCSS